MLLGIWMAQLGPTLFPAQTYHVGTSFSLFVWSWQQMSDAFLFYTVSFAGLVICSLSLTKDKATNPSNRQEDWEYIIGFCDQINKELEGWVSQTALDLINQHSQFKIYHLILKMPCFLLYLLMGRSVYEETRCCRGCFLFCEWAAGLVDRGLGTGESRACLCQCLQLQGSPPAKPAPSVCEMGL